MMSQRAAVVPVFLLSLPRSGSTLLQRILASHADISTSPEPTFLLPLVHLDRSTDSLATFDQRYTAWAVQDFITSLPGGRESYQQHLADFSTDLYRAAAKDNARYHIDKTPKYHLIAEEILELFPRSPIIVLWRNPLSVVASIMTTWGKNGGRWNLDDFRIDLYEGILNLIRLVEQHPDRVIQLRYEDLVSHPEATISDICTRLDIRFDRSVLDRFSDVLIDGRVQDPNVTSSGFESLRSDRTDLWRTVLSNPIRRWWCRRYLKWLGQDNLATMGYELCDLLDAIDESRSSTKFLMSDLVDIPHGYLARLFEIQLFTRKWKNRRAGRPLLAHK